MPVQRGNVSLTNLQLLNALLYVAEHGCKWRGLPKRFGKWHTIYTRMNRWSKNGTLDRVFEKLQLDQIVHIRIEAFSLDSTTVKVHPDGTGALKKTGPQSIGKSRGGWTTKIHMVAADARTAITFALSPGNSHDAPEGRQLLRDLGSLLSCLFPHMQEDFAGKLPIQFSSRQEYALVTSCFPSSASIRSEVRSPGSDRPLEACLQSCAPALAGQRQHDSSGNE